MVNVRTGIPLLLLPLLPLLSAAQQGDTTAAATPPAARYSLQKADSLVQRKKFEQAIWAYINLYPAHPDTVVLRVRGLQGKIWDEDLPGFVKTTFARFAPMDPDISTFDFTGPTMDTVQLKRKAAWSEAIIKRISASTGAMKQ